MLTFNQWTILLSATKTCYHSSFISFWDTKCYTPYTLPFSGTMRVFKNYGSGYSLPIFLSTWTTAVVSLLPLCSPTICPHKLVSFEWEAEVSPSSRLEFPSCVYAIQLLSLVNLLLTSQSLSQLDVLEVWGVPRDSACIDWPIAWRRYVAVPPFTTSR